MNIKDTSDLILKLEQDFDVNKIEYKKIKLWPIVRAYIYGKHVFGNREDHDHKEICKSWFRLKKNLFQHTKAAKALLRKSIFTQNVDYLFIGRTVDHTDKISGKPYSRHTDPYYEIFAEKFNCAKIEIGQKQPRYINTIFLPYWITLFETPQKKLKGSYIKILSDIYNSSFEDEEISVFLDYIFERTFRISYLSKLFNILLKKIDPHKVFIVCYHDEISSAIILACNKLRIPTIEIQHGQQGVYNSLYCRWTKIPKNGYSLLPSYIWMWGEDSKNNFLTDRINRRVKPVPFVGGNLWLKKCIDSDISIISEDLYSFKKQFNIIITVITTPMNKFDELISNFVTETIKSNPPNIGWVVRLHPNQTNDFDDIREFLKEKLIYQNFFLEKPEHSSLFGLLKISNYLITKWSSVAYEALSFNINPIITDQNGKVLFSEKIKTGVFNYVENEQQLYETITKPKKFVNDDNSFIDTSDHKLDAAIKFIISN